MPLDIEFVFPLGSTIRWWLYFAILSQALLIRLFLPDAEEVVTIARE